MLPQPHNRDTSAARQQRRQRMTVQVPGYVSTSSWTCTSADAPLPATQKGRTVTPPPSCFVGLHRLALEAFWQD